MFYVINQKSTKKRIIFNNKLFLLYKTNLPEENICEFDKEWIAANPR